MRADDAPFTHTDSPRSSTAAAQSRCPVPGCAVDRLIRQVEAIDAWVATRRARETILRERSTNRDGRMDATREVDVLRRTHDAIRGCCARHLAGAGEPMRYLHPTAVVAHRQPWFVEKVALLLDQRGVTVLVRTDNGAEALGAVVAEQPDILLVGDRLAMMTSGELLADAHRFAPCTLRAVRESVEQPAGADRPEADVVLTAARPAEDVADALVALHVERTGERRGVRSAGPRGAWT